MPATVYVVMQKITKVTEGGNINRLLAFYYDGELQFVVDDPYNSELANKHVRSTDEVIFINDPIVISHREYQRLLREHARR